MKSLRYLVIGAALLLAAGCADYTLVAANKPVNVGNGVTVTSEIAWAEAPSPGIDGKVWTADGIDLDSLMFFTGVTQGKPLIKPDFVRNKELRKYDTTMIPDDVMELASSNFGHLGFQQVKTSGLRPAKFGNAQGFRFDMDFLTQEGLEMKATALAAQRGKTLDLILFMAPDEYYYGHYTATIDKVFDSVQMAK